MKILIVMAGFFPGKKYGGPPVSVDNFCSLMKEHECYVVTKNHEKGDSTPYEAIHDGWNDRANCCVLYLNESEYNKNSFENIIEEIKPDILYLQGLFQACILPCLQLAKRHGIHVLLAPRGELCAGALNIRKYKKLAYIHMIRARGLVSNIRFQSTSEEETEAIHRLLKVSMDKIYHLDNIPSIPQKEYPRRDKVVGEGHFVFLSRIHPKKNLLSAIKYFHDVQGSAVFDIYGPIEDEAYWVECQREIKRLPERVSVNYQGLVGHDQVHEVFSQYDAFLFPTFSENYGHVIAESLIVGTPVIISDQTPWRKLEEFGAGWDVPLRDDCLFIQSMQKIIAYSSDDMKQMHENSRRYISQALNIDELKRRYSAVFTIS